MRATTTGRVLQYPRNGSFRFDAGAVCLDFAHSGGEGEYAVFESLHEPADLADWLAHPPLAAAVTVPVTAAELKAAKALRQAIWVAAHARAAGRALPADVVATLNRAAAEPPLVPELRAAPGAADTATGGDTAAGGDGDTGTDAVQAAAPRPGGRRRWRRRRRSRRWHAR